MLNLAQFFSYMNDIDFKYVVLRNWENLPDFPETGEHSDLDLLVYDLDHFLEVFPHLERVYPHPRVQFKLRLDNNEFVQLDARYLGDGYYPYRFEENMLKSRVWNKKGFWTPNPIHHKIGIAYHCVHHKNANTYPHIMFGLTVPKLLETLKSNPEFAWVEPEDPSVGRFNKYMKGATSIIEGNGTWVEKKQYRYLSYDLVTNEERILRKLNSIHFPKLLGRNLKTIRIEHCGEPLMMQNLPDNWREQFLDILSELDKQKVVHRDIRLENLMVKDGIIKLLDFGWARFSDEKDGKHPDLLGYPNKCPLGFNDRYSMGRVIKQIEFHLEEKCVSSE